MRLPCKADGCRKPRHSRGYCTTHYWRLRKYGTPELPKRERKPSSWVTRFGYRVLYLPDHPMANSAGAVTEHRLVMSVLIDRMLMPSESVHHLNGDRLDNRPDNLELWTTSQPAGQRVVDKVAWAIELLKTYRPELLSAEALDDDSAASDRVTVGTP